MPDASGNICYLVADNDGIDGSPDLLTTVNRNTGAGTAVGTGTNTSRIEAIAFDPINGILYATNRGNFGTIDTSSGEFESIGQTGYGDVDGLSVDPFTGEIFGSVRRGSNPDLLIKINPTTGDADPNAFGPGIESVVIPAVTANLDDIDDLTVDPKTGQLFGIANNGGNGDRYVWINRNTGAIEDEGALNINDMEGLSSFNQGQIYGTTGNAQGGTNADSFYIIDSSNGSASRQFGLNLGRDYESVDCLTGAPNVIEGNVFHDIDGSTTLNSGDTGTENVTVYLFRDDGAGNIVDINRDNVVDNNDALATQDTSNSGSYRFTIAGNGQYILKVDENDLPSGSRITTSNGVNINTADLGTSIGATIGNINFGHIGPFSIGDRVWFDLDDDGNQDNNEIGIRDVDLSLQTGSCSSNGSEIEQVTTGNNGAYTFESVPIGDYCVKVDESTLPAPGYEVTTSGQSIDVTVSTDDITTADFGYIATSCLPTITFETDAQGNALSAGTKIDSQWAGWGINISSNNQSNRPANLYNTAVLGNDPDLGAPNQGFSGIGEGDGGAPGTPGENANPQGLVLIINKDNNVSSPNDFAGGGTLTFTFDIPLRLDEISILDTDTTKFDGIVRAYDAKTGGSLLSSAPIYGYGNNSFQNVPINATDVQRLEVQLQSSGSVPMINFCAESPTSFADIGDTLWEDFDRDGVLNNGEEGLANITLELLSPGIVGVITETQTNSNGEYKFENLLPGSYQVKIADSNFAEDASLEDWLLSPINSGSDDTKDSDFNITTRRADVTLSTSNISTIDGGLYDPATNLPDLLLVKRVTAINTSAITSIIDGAGSEDNDTRWPTDYLKGSIDQSTAQPGDEIEYTIYFLATGYVDLKNVNFCDLIPTQTTYKSGSGKLAFDTTENSWDDSRNSDSGEYIPPNQGVTQSDISGVGLCHPDNALSDNFLASQNPNGAVWVQIDNDLTALESGQAGYIRFRVTVDETPTS